MKTVVVAQVRCVGLVLSAVLWACGSNESATVVEVPPQPLPAAPQPTAEVVQQPVEAAPSRTHQEWVGTYMCAQGQTDLALHLDVSGASVEGVFEFSHAPSGAEGAYKLRGSVDANGNMRLTPGAWMNRPQGYVSVGMRGVVRGNMFTGRMENPSCGDFSLQLR